MAWVQSLLTAYVGIYVVYCNINLIQVVIDLRPTQPTTLRLRPAVRQFRSQSPGSTGSWSHSHSSDQLETGLVQHTSSVSVCLWSVSVSFVLEIYRQPLLPHPFRKMSTKRKQSLSTHKPAKKEKKAIDLNTKMMVIRQHERGKKSMRLDVMCRRFCRIQRKDSWSCLSL